jgi:hypothetical protein
MLNCPFQALIIIALWQINHMNQASFLDLCECHTPSCIGTRAGWLWVPMQFLVWLLAWFWSHWKQGSGLWQT